MSVQACVAGMFELQDHAAFKDHLRDFLVQTKSFSSQDNADLFADEAAAAREVCLPALAYHGKSVLPITACPDACSCICTGDSVASHSQCLQ